METQIITSSQKIDDVKIELTPDAVKQKSDLLEAAKKITEIKDIFTQDSASTLLAQINGAIKAIKEAHDELKKPYLEIGRKIDKIQNDYLSGLSEEKTRLSLGIGNYVAEQKRIAEEEARKAAEEAARVQREKEAAERARIEAERALQAAEDGDDFDAIAEASEKITIANDTIADTARQESEIAERASAPLFARTAKTATYTTLKFEIVDRAALLATHPEFFEPNESLIREHLRQFKDVPNLQISGLKIWTETKAKAL